jgi:histidine ammonia-lyase
VVGVELLAAAQGLDFHAPLKSSPVAESARAAIRAAVPHLERDRYMADPLAWAKAAVLDGSLAEAGGFDPPM